jgi:hypothetical protein
LGTIWFRCSIPGFNITVLNITCGAGNATNGNSFYNFPLIAKIYVVSTVFLNVLSCLKGKKDGENCWKMKKWRIVL